MTPEGVFFNIDTSGFPVQHPSNGWRQNFSIDISLSPENKIVDIFREVDLLIQDIVQEDVKYQNSNIYYRAINHHMEGGVFRNERGTIHNDSFKNEYLDTFLKNFNLINIRMVDGVVSQCPPYKDMDEFDTENWISNIKLYFDTESDPKMGNRTYGHTLISKWNATEVKPTPSETRRYNLYY